MYSAKQRQEADFSFIEGANNSPPMPLEVIIDQLASENKSEWEILQFIAWLNPNFIPEEILFELGVNDRRRLWGIIGKLEKLSLVSVIKKDSRRGLLVKWPVQDATVKYVSKYPNKSKSPSLIVERLLQLLNKFLPEVTEIPDENWNLAGVYLPTVESIFELSANRKILLPKSKELASLNAKLGSIYEHILIDARRSLEYHEKALAIYKSIYKGNHPDVACSLHIVGFAYQTLGDTKTSLIYFNRALTMYQCLYRGNHPDLASSYNSVGLAHQDLGDATEALANFKKALNIRQALYTRNHVDVAQSLNNVGASYYALGHVNQGLAYFDRALIIYQSIYTGNHPDIALALNNLGIAYEKVGDIKIGLIYHERSLAMYQSLYEGSHPDVSSTLSAVGAAYTYLNDFGKHNLYKRLSSLPNGFINKRGLVTGNILIVKQKLQKQVLNKIQALSAKGEWSKRYMGFEWGVLGYIDEGYLEKQLGDLNNDENIKIALALCFEAITIGIANSEEQNFKCVSEFTITYPDLISEYAKEHPEYFVLETIFAFCLELADYDTQFVPFSLDEGPIEEFKGQGTLSYNGKSYYEYYNTAIDKLLAARLGILDSQIKRLDSWYLTSVSKLAYKVSSEFTNNEIELVLAPVNLYNKHWLGLAFRKLDDAIEVTYMDSEQGPMLSVLQTELKNCLSSFGYKVRFLQVRLEKQRYNNCGLEVIENFVYYLTGSRATQEAAVYVHSLLLENSLLDTEIYGLKLEENTNLIKFLSNAEPIGIQEITLFAEQGSKTKHESAVADNSLDKLTTDLYRANILFKALDFAVDSARLVQEPSIPSLKKLVLDYAYLQAMVSGVNSYSAMIAGAETLYQLQLGEYQRAFNVASSTMSAMALPVILAMANRPCFSLAYGVWLVASTAYGAITNAYSFATEFSDKDAALRSAMAYKDLAVVLAASPLQSVYDFESRVKEYKLQINDLLFDKEKSLVQAKVKGEFEQKVFDYIYLPELIEKYVLLNDVIRSELTEEEAKTLKSKPIAISYGELEYDHCVRVEDSGKETTERYYCCNIAGQILDYVILTDSGGLEVLERL